MITSNIGRVLFWCYRKIFRGYFGYRYSQRKKQDIEIGRVTLEDLGILEHINEFLDDTSKVKRAE